MVKDTRSTPCVVQVARLRIETAFVAFAMIDEHSTDVEAMAVYLAEALPDEAWSASRFDAEEYGPFVLRRVPRGGKDEKSSSGEHVEKSGRHIKFVLLAADMSEGVGLFIDQPWLANGSKVLRTQMISDWIANLGGLFASNGKDI